MTKKISGWAQMEKQSKREPNVIGLETNTIVLEDLQGYKIGQCFLTMKKRLLRFHGVRIQDIEKLERGYRLIFDWFMVQSEVK